MFDGSLPEPEALGAAADASVVAAIEGWAQVEAAAAARRLAAIAELTARRCAAGGHARWACDDWDGAAAEVSAALTVSHGRASGQMTLAACLRTRLPRVAAVFAAGRLSAWLASVIAWRTYLITDPDALAAVDAALAERAEGWGPLSLIKLQHAIDEWVDRYDPGALRHTRASARSRDVVVGSPDDHGGTAALWGRLYTHDAALLDRRLAAMAHGVCEEDPRTIAQRRADALGALAAGADTLACGCGRPDCPTADAPDARAASVVIHVLVEPEGLTSTPDPHQNGQPPPRPPRTPDTDLTAPPPAEPDPPPPAPPGRILGGGILPAPLLAALIAAGATVRPLQPPTAAPEVGYRPSAALADYVRCRDLTCRFPGCDRPAEYCDIDHTTPWPAGPTHHRNLKCLCRKHHLLKTFWAWRDTQLPDGTIIWTSPTTKVGLV